MAEKVLERRSISVPLEMRMEGDAPVLVGYAATFDQPYDLGPFTEKIDRGAFSRTLGSNPDVRLLIDHEGQPLARTDRLRGDGSLVRGTMTLRDRDDAGNALPGLEVRTVLDPSDPDVQRLVPKMRRGDLDQMSFAFRVPAGGDSWSDDWSERTLRAVELNGGDVSVVTYPANPATTVSLRTADVVAAKTVFVESVMREVRAGKAISAATLEKLQTVLASLAVIDSHLDAADDGLDAAQAAMADLLGVANPDPADPEDDKPQMNSGRPLGLALATARRLGIAS